MSKVAHWEGFANWSRVVVHCFRHIKSMGSYIQTRPHMWKLAHGHVSKVKYGAQTRIFRVNMSHNLLRLYTTKYLSLLLT